MAIVDEFGGNPIIGENGAERTGFAVVEAAHGVVGMGGTGGSGGNGGGGFCERCGGVSERDLDVLLGELLDEGDGAGLFGSDGDGLEFGMVEHGLPFAFEVGDFEDGFGRLSSGVVGGNEGALQVESGDHGVVVEMSHGFANIDSGGGDGCGEEELVAFLEQLVGPLFHLVVVGGHEVDPERSVDVEIDESGDEIALGLGVCGGEFGAVKRIDAPPLSPPRFDDSHGFREYPDPSLMIRPSSSSIVSSERSSEGDISMVWRIFSGFWGMSPSCSMIRFWVGVRSVVDGWVSTGVRSHSEDSRIWSGWSTRIAPSRISMCEPL